MPISEQTSPFGFEKLYVKFSKAATGQSQIQKWSQFPFEGADEFTAAIGTAADAKRHDRAVAWLIETMHGDRVVSAEVTFIPSVAERNESAGYCVTPLYTAPPPPAAMQEPVAVKALEWECVVGDVEVAGSYKIDRMRPLLSGKPKKYWVQIALGFGLETVATLCSTLDEAKAAAQADYEQRVRSALSTSKSDPAPEIAALRAAIERLLGALATIIEKNQEREFMGDDASDGYGNRGWVVRDGQYARIARASVAPEQEGAK